MGIGGEKKKKMIRVKESTMVRPAKATPRQKLWNSNLDLVVGRIHLLTVYFYRSPNVSSSNFFDARVLKEALSNVLVSFYPMAGRLGLAEEEEEEGGRRLVIDCNAEGVLFVEAETDYTLDDFGHFTPSAEQRRLAPTVDYSAHISSYPLFIAQVTYFKCGGVSLGCGMHHTLSDGISSLHFINSWSDISRGLPVAIPPFIDRTLLRARDPPHPIFDHIEYHAPPSSMNKSLKATGVVSTAILQLTLDQLNELKRKAKSDSDTTDLSSYAILAAHLWRCVCKARGLCDDQMTKLYVATDGRLRLSPMVPPGYLGNVVFTATHVAQSGDIISEPLANSAKKIQKEVAKMDNGYLRSALDYLESQADLSALVRGPNYFASPNLNINSWIKLPIHDADFGWGRPIFMGPASILYEGTIYVIPSPNKDGSVSLALCLDADHIPLFEKYLYDF